MSQQYFFPVATIHNSIDAVMESPINEETIQEVIMEISTYDDYYLQNSDILLNVSTKEVFLFLFLFLKRGISSNNNPKKTAFCNMKKIYQM